MFGQKKQIDKNKKKEKYSFKRRLQLLSVEKTASNVAFKFIPMILVFIMLVPVLKNVYSISVIDTGIASAVTNVNTLTKAEVFKVIDGNTIEINTEEEKRLRIRLECVSLPIVPTETDITKNDYNTLAKAYLEQIAAANEYLYIDYTGNYDSLNQPYAYVWYSILANTSEPTEDDMIKYQLNADMLSRGYGKYVKSTGDDKYSQLCESISLQAEDSNKGFWQYSSFRTL